MSAPAAKRRNYKKIAGELGARVVWALKFMRSKGSGNVVSIKRDADGNVRAIGKSQRWEDWFMDGLDQVGYVIDRKKFYAAKSRKKSVCK